MTISTNIKESVFNQIMTIIEKRIESAKQAIASAKESRDNETKSSVGDKYETGRAMMQMELEKNRVQLNKALKMKNEMEQINLQKKYDKVEFGSLVITSNGNYFISIGIGKIEIKNNVCFSISLASPIGKVLQNKKVNDRFKFMGKEISILKIV
jgi:transcription elongation GreA/GreB family factor